MKIAKWNGKYGKKNNYKTISMKKWEYFNCMKEVYFYGTLENKVIRVVIPQKIIQLVSGIMQYKYGIKSLSKKSLEESTEE